jgi:hypothetical protein
MDYKRKVSNSHYLHIQAYSILNRINESGFSVPWVLIVRVFMFVQQVLLRLALWDCWLVVALGQTEHCHGRSDAERFCFSCSMRDARARKRFLINLTAIFWRKGAPTANLENDWEITFLHGYIELEGRSWRNTLPSILLVYCAS